MVTWYLPGCRLARGTDLLTVNWSEFTLKLEPNNFGVMLRRKLDYQFPNQRAKVSIADASNPQKTPADWKPAGVWYLAHFSAIFFSQAARIVGCHD